MRFFQYVFIFMLLFFKLNELKELNDIDNFFRLFYNRIMDINSLTFEEALKKLEENVLSLEKGDLGLEESIRTYEEGIKYSDYLIEKLESAEKRVEELTAKNDGKGRMSFSTESMDI